MSNQYPGGIITKNPATPTGPYDNGAAPGIWTLTQQAAYAKQGIWPTAGNTDPSLFIENLFQTWLYTGTGASQTITNGIDLSTKGGLVWIKERNSPGNYHVLTDTVRGTDSQLRSNSDVAPDTEANRLTAFTTSGFSLGNSSFVNGNTNPLVSWTFRKQPKFFDIQTWTGSGANRTISHSLGSVPACIMVKRTDTTGDWQVYHRSLANTEYLVLNTTAAKATGATRWNSTTPTSSVFSLGTDASVNASVGTYVAYIFAHDAGGFGLTGTDNVISCGSFTTDGSGNATVSLGYEPQWVLYKGISGTGGVSDWVLADTMRGYALTGSKYLAPNSTQAEGGLVGNPTATGFVVSDTITTTWIYIAIRRGPMKVPTLGTTVFTPIARTGTGANATVTSVGFPVDLLMSTARNGNDAESWWDRLRNTGGAGRLLPSSTSAEIAGSTDSLTGLDVMDGFKVGVDTNGRINYSPWTYVYHCFRRAPSFFDEVCYTGTGAVQNVTHNLTVVPELMIFKSRSDVRNWIVYSSTLGATKNLRLNATDAEDTNTYWNNTTPTASVFSIDSSVVVNASASTFVAYLFATCAGVSKVGSYTGNGTTQTIDCGFGAGGARFVLIKRTDATGDWYVYDTARGMTVLTDPYLLMNSTAAEVATLGSVTTVSTGFALNSTILAAINVNAGTYIFLAIA